MMYTYTRSEASQRLDRKNYVEFAPLTPIHNRCLVYLGFGSRESIYLGFGYRESTCPVYLVFGFCDPAGLVIGWILEWRNISAPK